MTVKIHALALLSALALAGTAHAECSRPPEPTLPEGANASQDEMVTGQQSVKSYIDETNKFLECLEGEEMDAVSVAEENGKPLTPAERNTYVERYNAAVDSMQAVAESFNAELRVYLDKNK